MVYNARRHACCHDGVLRPRTHASRVYRSGNARSADQLRARLVAGVNIQIQIFGCKFVILKCSVTVKSMTKSFSKLAFIFC